MYQIGLMYDRKFTAWAVRTALAAVPDIEVHSLSGEAGHNSRAPRRFHVLITDRSPSVPNAGAIASQVLLMAPTDPPADLDLRACGFDGYLSERSTPAQLATAVRAAAARAARPGPNLPGASLRAVAERDDKDSQLSDRERQVLHFIADGYTHDQTARRLGISPHTVNTYVKRARCKLGVGNKAELARAALVSGW